MLITATFKKSLIVEQFQGNYLNCTTGNVVCITIINHVFTLHNAERVLKYPLFQRFVAKLFLLPKRNTVCPVNK